ncbi:isoprene synthase, chloroplastic isoform X2 [Jatropha curcas]|nr:isoprene synthase, chloroplastic isoform X2 [Jatropha curcas]
MITDENAELLVVLDIIDNVQRLGLGYRFENEIRRALDRFVSSGIFDAAVNNGLHATALSFRLLREHGYKVSPDVLMKFKGENGNFKECLAEDVKAILGLYEASFLAFEGENLLDEANKFARLHLKGLKEKENIGKDIVEQVNHELELPLHRRTQRLEALWSIEAYSKRDDANQALLELAVMDFNMVQSIHQRDLRDMSRWWRNMGLPNKLDFARDRLTESFFWATGMVFEPQYSNCRRALTKAAKLITLLDDVYDVYGTLDELELFTDAVQRWDVNAINTLPDYMKLCFLALYNTVNEMTYEALMETGENILPYLTNAWANLLKTFLQEAKWFYNKSTPTFEEYLENAWMSVSGPLLLVSAYCFLSKKSTKQELENLEKNHNLLRWPSIIFRLCNDMGSSSAELERGETGNSITYYMNDNGVTEEVAKQHVRNLIDETWKKMNKERIENSILAKPFVETAFNLARIAHCIYQYGDGHSAPDERSKKRVASVIIEPLSLKDR